MSAAIDRELLEVSLKGLSKRMNQLILQGADVNTANDHIRKVPKGYRPLDCALVSGKIGCVELLIRNYAIIDNDIQQRHLGNSSTLALAASLGFYDAVKLLVEHGANVNGSVNAIPPLFAIFDRYDRYNLPFDENGMNIVRYLVERGADVHRSWLSQDKRPYIGTLPMRAINHPYNDFELLKFFIQNKVDLFVKNSLGDTIHDILAVRKSPDADRANAIVKAIAFMDFSGNDDSHAEAEDLEVVTEGAIQEKTGTDEEDDAVLFTEDFLESVADVNISETVNLGFMGQDSVFSYAKPMDAQEQGRLVEQTFFSSIQDVTDTALDEMLANTEIVANREDESDEKDADQCEESIAEEESAVKLDADSIVKAIDQQVKKPKDMMRASLNDQLLIATAIGNSAVMNLLIDQGANVEAVATKNFSGVLKGETPLMCAVRYADKECMKTLVRRGADAKSLSVFLQAHGDA